SPTRPPPSPSRCRSPCAGRGGDRLELRPDRVGEFGDRPPGELRDHQHAAVGDYKLIATLRVGNQELTDSIAITVVEGRERDGRGGRGKGRMKKKAKEKRQVPVGPEVNWIKRDGWDEHDYTATTVGHVDESDRGVDIYLNLDFDKLFEVLSNPRYTPPVVEARKSAYMVPTALGLYRIHQLDNENDLPDDVVRRMQTVVADSVLLATDPEGVLGMSAEEAED
ncbi:MAG TPA: hypothetical protein VFB34_11310, partial [Chloroflexota bacterium]|nr:hypothetical protein [Chloroflexota bacterium]